MSRVHVRLSFFIQIKKMRSEHFILLLILYFLQAESFIWQVMFILEINTLWWAECQMVFYTVAPKAGKVNLLYHTSNRGHFLFHNLHIGWVKSNIKFNEIQFCAIQLILVCFWSNYTSALISCISLSHNKSLNRAATTLTMPNIL